MRKKELESYCYQGTDLGISYHAEKSSFKVWAPLAMQVELILYPGFKKESENDVQENIQIEKSYDMEVFEGIWSVCIEGNLDGFFYLYRVTNEKGEKKYSLDPYGRAANANGEKNAIIDFSKTNPNDWEMSKYKKNVRPEEAIIMELHVRDFSIGKDVAFNYPGMYLAFTETGLKTEGGYLAGIDSLEELGITHVQIQPIYDFACVNELTVKDENSTERKYNWGYDPANYNFPEGSYATNPEDPYSRIKELKEMVAALHRKNIGVIMDVVYNHTFDINQGPFQVLVPDYFYRMKNGTFANGSQCGNEIASEKPMVRKYILDSLQYWVTEYGIDGFRFDLMGLIDVQTMATVVNQVRTEQNQKILVYGEPWQAGGSALAKKKQTLKGSQKNLGFGVFNDNFRNAIKGSSRDQEGGFATGRVRYEKRILEGVTGSIQTIAENPMETINYVTAHDDLNLWDKMVVTLKKEKEEGFLQIEDGVLKTGGSLENAVLQTTIHHGVEKGKELEHPGVKACLFANAIIFTSQGIPFFQGGDEFLRSKYGDENSYRSPDCINEIHWSEKEMFYQVFLYYKGMISLRRQHPAFTMSSKDQIWRHIEVHEKKGRILCFSLKEHANQDSWKQIVVIYNGNLQEAMVSLPNSGVWNIVVNHLKAGVEIIAVVEGNKVMVKETSVMVLYQE